MSDATPDPLVSSSPANWSSENEQAIWQRAELAALVFAVDPSGLGGLHLKAGAGPTRDFWLSQLKQLFDPSVPVRKMPIAIDTERLLGGLDLAATLNKGKPILQRGLLAEVDSGLLIIPMAEKISRDSAAYIASALDLGHVQVERQASSAISKSVFGTILLDESGEEPSRPPDILLDRVALRLSLDGLSIHARRSFSSDRTTILSAQNTLPKVTISDDIIGALSEACLSIGEQSVRRLYHCVRVARIHAALCDRREVEPQDAIIAATLVIGYTPTSPEEEAGDDEHASPDNNPEDHSSEQNTSDQEKNTDDEKTQPQQLEQSLEDMVIEAVRGASVSDALINLHKDDSPKPSGQVGVSGSAVRSRTQGRAIGVRRGDPRREGRLDILATLRAGAPWQKLRAGAQGQKLRAGAQGHISDQSDTTETKIGPIKLRPEDFHVKQYETKSQTVVIFVVDASGSSALNRMAEAKGAVEQLLADCYARRDQVALIAFRDKTAELLLPPTRSLVRARRHLAQLPGGGGTPLAAGLNEALMVAQAERAKGSTPYIVFLSDGRGNIDLSQQPGRERAQADAMLCARRIKAADITCLFFDTSPRPDPRTKALAAAMGANVRALPRSGGDVISQSVRALTT